MEIKTWKRNASLYFARNIRKYALNCSVVRSVRLTSFKERKASSEQKFMIIWVTWSYLRHTKILKRRYLNTRKEAAALHVKYKMPNRMYLVSFIKGDFVLFQSVNERRHKLCMYVQAEICILEARPYFVWFFEYFMGGKWALARFEHAVQYLALRENEPSKKTFMNQA